MLSFLLTAILQIITITRPTTLAFQGSATATWQANPVTDNITSYRLYYGLAPSTYTFTPIDIPAPATTVIVPGLVPGVTYYFALQALAGNAVSALSTEVKFTVPQVTNNCLDAIGNPAVQLRVLDFTNKVASNGLGRLLWSITSLNRIINITATLNGSPISIIDGADSKTVDLSKTAGVNFIAPSISGNYTLVVSAMDINACKADTSSVTRVVNVP